MARRRVSGTWQVLIGIVITVGCSGAACDDILPQSRFLLFEPFELEESGFCEDWGPGEIFHEQDDCYRRENCLFDCPQICMNEAGDRVDSRDTVSPVIATAPNGRCLYDMPWDPVSGVLGHPILWAHLATDIVGRRLLGRM